jgi:putative aminopeptidase FrvX
VNGIEEDRMRKIRGWIFMSAALLIFFGQVEAAPADLKSLIKDISAIPSVTGNEELLAAKISSFLPKNAASEKDNLGSLFARFGAAEPGLAVVAALDEFGYVVSGFSDDGYLRLDRASQVPHSLFDSYLLGHPVVISTKTGLQNGVVAQPSMHLLTRERRDQISNSFSLDLVFVDVGARSEEEARAKGIEILDPVTFQPGLAALANDRWAGPSLGQKALCAALTGAAIDLGPARLSQGAAFVWMAQTRVSARGGGRAALGAVRARNKIRPRLAIVLDAVPAERSEKSPLIGKGPVLVQVKEGSSRLKDALEAAARARNISLQYQVGGESPLLNSFLSEGVDALALALPVKFSQTPSEVVDLKDCQAISEIVVAVIHSGGLK